MGKWLLKHCNPSREPPSGKRTTKYAYEEGERIDKRERGLSSSQDAHCSGNRFGGLKHCFETTNSFTQIDRRTIFLWPEKTLSPLLELFLNDAWANNGSTDDRSWLFAPGSSSFSSFETGPN